MALTPGLYVFTCGECEGSGEMEVGNRDYGDHQLVPCDECNGTGQMEMDEDEADEAIDNGWDPVSTP